MNRKTTKLLYLYHKHAMAGLEHITCRQFLESLRTDYDVQEVFCIVSDDAIGSARKTFGGQVLAEGDLFTQGFEILVIERGLMLNYPSEKMPKIEAATIRRFMWEGGIVLFLCDEAPTFLPEYNRFLADAGLPQLAHPHSLNDFPDRFPGDAEGSNYDVDLINGYDGGKRFSIEMAPERVLRMPFNIRPVFEGVSRVYLHYPILLNADAKPLLVGGLGTKMITSSDRWYDGSPSFVPAGYVDAGNGVGIVMTGSVVSDASLAAHESDSIRFVKNVISVMLDGQRKRRGFLGLEDVLKKVQLTGNLLEGEPSELEKRYDVIAAEFLEAASRYPPADQYLKDAEEFLKVCLRDVWDWLVPDAKQFLISGEAHLRSFRSTGRIDFGGASLYYSKCLELELNIELLGSFKTAAKRDGIVFSAPEGRAENDIDRFITEGQPMTLGALAYILERAAEDGQSRVSAFGRYIRQTTPDPAFWLGKQARMTTILHKITHKYRNGFAHTENQTLEICAEWRSLLLGIKEEGLLEQVYRNMPR